MIKLENILDEVSNAAGVNMGSTAGKPIPKAIILAGAPGAGKNCPNFACASGTAARNAAKISVERLRPLLPKQWLMLIKNLLVK